MRRRWGFRAPANREAFIKYSVFTRAGPSVTVLCLYNVMTRKVGLGAERFLIPERPS